jgi:hypothetical protein
VKTALWLSLINWVHVDVDRSAFPTIDAALIIGDALHNLRSALDILYFQAMRETTGITDHRTRFPIRKDRQKLVVAINGGLKEKGLADNPSAITIRDVIVDVVKAYQAGNRPPVVLARYEHHGQASTVYSNIRPYAIQ